MTSTAPFETAFAHSVAHDKYMAPHGETHWSQLAKRVVTHPMKSLSDHAGRSYNAECEVLYDLLNKRHFIPGGRYLYATGNGLHQTQNCLLLRAEDTREGWANLSWQTEMALLTGAGVGVYYGEIRGEGTPIKRTGGTASGPVPKMCSINELGRSAVQGGNRRSAIWAGLLWSHPDCAKFIRAKDWPEWLREQKDKDYSTAAPLDMTNISVCLDDEFFDAYHNPAHEKHDLAHTVYWTTVGKMVTTGEPGFSVDLGERSNEKLRNAPVVGATRVLTDSGYRQADEIVDVPTTVWTGKQWASDVVFTRSPDTDTVVQVTLTGGRKIICDPSHPFMVCGHRVAAEDLTLNQAIDVSLPSVQRGELDTDAYTLGWIYGDGSVSPAGRAELTLCSDESKASRHWLAEPRSENASDGRGYHRLYYGGGYSGLVKTNLNAAVFGYGADEAASFVAGLFDADGNYEPTQERIRLASKHRSFLDDVARLLEQLGIVAHVSLAGTSTYGQSQGYQLVVAACYHDLFVKLIPCKRVPLAPRRNRPYRKSTIKVVGLELLPGEPVYCADVGVPEHTFVAEGVVLSNCTEIVSEDDSDVCNLGGLVLSRFDDPQQFGAAVRHAVLFLTAGTVYSHLPYDKVAEVREKNRRLGCDLMGVHEFLLMRGLKYGSDDAFEALEPFMDEYDRALEYAHEWQDEAGLSLSKAAQAGSPTGTRGIVAESTTSWEPVTAAAYKRIVRHASGSAERRETHYVVDPTVARLARDGYIDPHDLVEDSFSLANDVERRLKMQAYAQSHTDQAISMTINLPHPLRSREEQRSLGNTLIEYLPQLRGITMYPNNARAGQPITPCPVDEALAQGSNVVIEENEEKCASGTCGL